MLSDFLIFRDSMLIGQFLSRTDFLFSTRIVAADQRRQHQGRCGQDQRHDVDHKVDRTGLRPCAGGPHAGAARALTATRRRPIELVIRSGTLAARIAAFDAWPILHILRKTLLHCLLLRLGLDKAIDSERRLQQQRNGNDNTEPIIQFNHHSLSPFFIRLSFRYIV